MRGMKQIAAVLLVLAVCPALASAQTGGDSSRNVGVVTTLAGNATVARVSLAHPQPLRFKDDADRRMVGYISLGPRVGYVAPLSAGRTWEHAPSSESVAELPPFQGPAAPLGGGYVGIEIEFRFALESSGIGSAKPQ